MSGVDQFNQRADLALAKQGVLTDKELLSIDDLRDAWNAQSDAFNSWDELGIDEIIWFAQQQAIARHARPAIQPVTVAERPWESEGWCDADGECWWCPRDGPPYWQMANPAMVYGGWLLPHHALPIPQPTSTP
jgi:hypothetical protein